MDIIALIVGLGGWAWILAGVVLLGLELVAPGGVLVWMGVAGIVTGLMALFQPLSWPMQGLIFGGLSLVSIFGWLRYSKNRGDDSDRPFLNRRADRLVGQEALLAEPIAGGFGRVAVGDSVWRVTGPDLPAGRRVRIVGSDGPLLQVEAVEESQ